VSGREDAVVQLARKAAYVANFRAESWDYHFERMLSEEGYKVERCDFLGWSRLRSQVVRQRLRYLIRAPDGQLLRLYVVLVVRVEPFAEETYSVECAMIDEP
jgi:hypothetical protein